MITVIHTSFKRAFGINKTRESNPERTERFSAVSSHGQSDEVLVGKSCASSHVPVATSERVSEPLDLNTGNDEIVQSHPPGFLVIFQQQILDKCGTEPISHLSESLSEFCHFYESTPILVNCLKHPFPLIDVREEGTKLMDVDRPRLVLIKHIDHHPARLLTEVAHVPVDQRTLQLLCINLSTPVLVHSLEPLSNLRAHLLMLRRGSSRVALLRSSSRISLLCCWAPSITLLWLWGWGSSISRLLLMWGWGSSITRISW